MHQKNIILNGKRGYIGYKHMDASSHAVHPKKQGAFCLRVGGKLFQAINEIGASKPTSWPVKNNAKCSKKSDENLRIYETIFFADQNKWIKKWLKKAGKERKKTSHPTNRTCPLQKVPKKC